MELIALIAVAITFTVCILSIIVYLKISKRMVIKYSKNKLLNDTSAFTYKNIVNALGTIENIVKVEENKIFLVSISLVDKKQLKKLTVKYQIEQDYIILSVKGFDINNFYKKLTLNIEKSN
ncbi:hypothetical protein [Spiroplasma culicicola]|uniref:PTS EIIB type-1 domain-containing protein n=1 Tax=Spiroplasma culicicola AES-1 TaxID=1276246 RepID=W6AFX1_9MOLU|nr:hypothetical protein [Spiroplasma culicicola]AHI52609.1 hypothetical protein SCULI_v1c02680 [Spiroplasma culicicola AES-1]